jgi:hypothetical protein
VHGSRWMKLSFYRTGVISNVMFSYEQSSEI